MRYLSVGEERLSVVPPGVDARFRPLDPEDVRQLRQTTPLGQRAILHVSTGVPYKNVPMTLRVLGALKEDGLDVALVRVGVPLNASEVSLARRLGVSGQVIECGRVDDDRLTELYNECDALLFPSWYEGFGWPPLEAMACGTPVVTSNTPALAEIVGDAAITASPWDVRGLTSGVRAILDHPEYARKLRIRGLERASHYSWSRTVAGVANVYRKVLEQSGRSAAINS
jgi:glycosyltransferase involved in cell wall biosynthesis